MTTLAARHKVPLMLLARLYDFGDIRLEEQARPEIGPDDMLVRTRACGICSGDIMPWYLKRKAPVVLGHEPVGVVEEVGSAVRGFRPGERVFVHHHAPCFKCAACRRGHYVHCATWRQSKITPGGMAEYFAVGPANQRDSFKLPDQVSDLDGVLIEPAACVVKSVNRSGLKPGETILIIGLGIMGMMHVRIARNRGAGLIIGADLFERRAARARELGADHTIAVKGDDLAERVREITNGAMADVVIVGPGQRESARRRNRGGGTRRDGGAIHLHAARRGDDDQAARPLLRRGAADSELFVRPRGYPRSDEPGRARRNRGVRPRDSSVSAGADQPGVRDRAAARGA